MYQVRKDLNCHWVAVLLLVVGTGLFMYSLAHPAAGPGGEPFARPDPSEYKVPTPLGLLDAGEPLPLTRDDLNAPFASDPSLNPACRWNFVEYVPSEFERSWRRRFEEIDLRMCDALWSDSDFKAHAVRYANAGDEGKLTPEERVAQAEGRKCAEWAGRNNSRATQGVLLAPPPPATFDDGTFSRMVYRLDCGGHGSHGTEPAHPASPGAPQEGDKRVTYLEPLAGPLRHVRVCRADRNVDRADFDKQLSRKDWLVTDTWTVHRNDPFVSPFHRARFLFFDFGASTWTKGNPGSSQNWFQALYAHRHCAPFDRLFVWETTPHSTEVYGPLPGHVAPRYHWLNKPVSADPNSWDNPLNVVLQEATPEDFVVLKIDIGTPHIENPLLDQILKHPAVAARVDELFFEHHVNVELLADCCWGRPPHRQDASLDLFARLRRIGIRAHSWI